MDQKKIGGGKRRHLSLRGRKVSKSLKCKIKNIFEINEQDYLQRAGNRDLRKRDSAADEMPGVQKRELCN